MRAVAATSVPRRRRRAMPAMITVFESALAPADHAAMRVLEQAVVNADLAAPAVVLPDFHHKPTMEMPSSIAVATRETIRATLTSTSVNCGMSLLALDCERPQEEALSEFYRRVLARFPFPPRRRPVISGADVMEAALHGAEWAVGRYGLRPEELPRIELGGRLDTEAYGGARRLRRELPWLVRQLARARFGTIGPSNHFIELQQVEHIYDQEAAARLGVQLGQVTLQYHGGGGVLAGEVGAMYGRRRKRKGGILRGAMALTKPVVHLARAESLAELRSRRRLYFGPDCPPVSRATREGERLMLTNAAAMNYGFAFRQATYAGLREIARECLGADSALVVDSPHNSIYEERLDGRAGRDVLVHRHNAARAFPAARMRQHPLATLGQPLLLPGTNRTSSYLCVAGSDVDRSLNSVCHGAGTMVADFVARCISGSDPEARATLRFRYSGQPPEWLTHFDDRGVNEALRILSENGLARAVARMRPFAGLS
jgi:tRNA-splicing ligase RtcB (3'-phosphate/5'-hydroxy nucleic acid ligase)